jgi:hypothetical protein
LLYSTIWQLTYRDGGTRDEGRGNWVVGQRLDF